MTSQNPLKLQYLLSKVMVDTSFSHEKPHNLVLTSLNTEKYTLNFIDMKN